MAKLNFEQPLLQSSMSHDPSEIIYHPIIIIYQYADLVLRFIFIINIKNSCAVCLEFFVETVIHIFFQDSLMKRN